MDHFTSKFSASSTRGSLVHWFLAFSNDCLVFISMIAFITSTLQVTSVYRLHQIWAIWYESQRIAWLKHQFYVECDLFWPLFRHVFKSGSLVLSQYCFSRWSKDQAKWLLPHFNFSSWTFARWLMHWNITGTSGIQDLFNNFRKIFKVSKIEKMSFQQNGRLS